MKDTSPDLYSLIGCEIKSFSRFHIEGFGPGIRIANDVRTELRRRVRIGKHLAPQSGLPSLRCPVLSERNIELLIASKTILPRRLGAVKRGPVTVVSGGDSPEVGDVLIDRLLAVHMHAGEKFIGIVLFLELHRRLVKVSTIGRGPPVADASFRVEGAAFLVEGVTDLVPDDLGRKSVV